MIIFCLSFTLILFSLILFCELFLDALETHSAASYFHTISSSMFSKFIMSLAIKSCVQKSQIKSDRLDNTMIEASLVRAHMTTRPCVWSPEARLIILALRRERREESWLSPVRQSGLVVSSIPRRAPSQRRGCSWGDAQGYSLASVLGHTLMLAPIHMCTHTHANTYTHFFFFFSNRNDKL